ncbi:holliday junction resolvase [Brevibacterium phage Cantare]|uniref:Holliday junction resolvase n=1 Tax=Brevibacterium phage Cantare TaxID=2338395 RepID=A0A3G3LYY0_9CAUD|nr:holliday junction resolvase [Brevibacterium phage Cantare]AYQ99295.1 holliday junction resolvase [Brevibacterium phage Cantare]
MDHVVIAVDPSTKKIAMAIQVPGREVELRIISLPGNDLSRKCARTHTKFKRVIKEYQAYGKVYVIVEAPVVGRGGAKPTIMQSKINGALQASGIIAGAVMLEDANNQSWKKEIVGKGNAGKPKVAEWLQQNRPKLYAMTGKDQDLIDACVILEFGMKIANRLTRGIHARP